ncbi:MAG: transcription antitermination factor NusB [Verrucomicrobiae bacterium]|jgi:N utilization substance protein B|nr:transcription antitermination factor NusB [Verrucomicrobiae bacterium]
MGVRHEGREAAVQFLYQRDHGGAASSSDLNDFYIFRGLSPAARRFCQQLAEGTLHEVSTIDALLKKNIHNYELGRLAAVDRNVLRLAIYEMLFSPQTPRTVIINEAINIAKKYGTEESGGFVNGVLDQIKKAS